MRLVSKQSTTAQKQEDLVFKALANRDRRAVLDFVHEAPRTTGEVCALLSKLDRCTVMLHLKVLEKSKLLAVKRIGRCKLHYLDVVPIQRVYERWIRSYAQPAASVLSDIAKRLETRSTTPAAKP